jgi:hypothetical protein
MFKPPENAWQLTEEDLPSSSFRFAVKEKPAQVWKQVIQRPAFFLIPLGLMLAIVWLVIQAFVLDVDFSIALKPDNLPKVMTSRLVVVPSPIRYSLLQTPAPEEVPLPPPVLELSKLPPGNNSIVPVNYTPSVLPPELSNPLPAPPPAPSFHLVGIAQGGDGSVATLKVEDDASGVKDQLQDVREGSPLLSGYVVSRITPDYVLIKDKKAGKTIRVE